MWLLERAPWLLPREELKSQKKETYFSETTSTFVPLVQLQRLTWRWKRQLVLMSKHPWFFYLILIWRQDVTVRASTMIIAKRRVEKPEKGNLLQWNDFNFCSVGAITTFDVALEAAACADVKTPLIFYLILIWRQDMTVRASTMIIAERGVEKPEKGNLLQWNDFNFCSVGAITTFDVALEATACADVKTPLIFYLILIWRQDMTVRASTMIIAERGVEKPEKGNLLQWNDFNFCSVGAITTFDVALEAAACADVKTPLIFLSNIDLTARYDC